MMIVSHRITVGEAVYASGAHSRLVELRTWSALGTPVNTARITLAPAVGLTISPEDEVVVEVGYDDELETIFTGSVGAVDWDIEHVTVHASGAFHKLVGARFNRFYEKSKAGDIVSDIAGLLDISTGSVESGLEFPAYAFSGGLNAYDSLRQLAQRCGFDLYADVDDQLVFAPYDAGETHPFQYGVNILALHLDHPTDSITGAEILGDSPASHGQGSDSSSWLTKKDVKGSAGDTGTGVWRRFDAAVRTQEDAGRIAEAVLDALRSRRVCTLDALGSPTARLGDAIEISSMPLDDQNGTFKITSVEHRLDIRKGFFTRIGGLEL
ncbi:MAG: hypothetical protein EHM39_04215 [Chloroflexi bacterium]|nr:MAG: hypothetical protein EHM39_04215 [Chloroflexota bacterium]